MEAADFTQCATHGSFSRRWQETLYNMFHFITLYVLPLLVMSCCYSRILLHIHLQHLRDKGKGSWSSPVLCVDRRRHQQEEAWPVNSGHAPSTGAK